MRPSTARPVRTLASVFITAGAATYGSTSTARPWKVSHRRPPRAGMGGAQRMPCRARWSRTAWSAATRWPVTKGR